MTTMQFLTAAWDDAAAAAAPPAAPGPAAWSFSQIDAAMAAGLRARLQNVVAEQAQTKQRGVQVEQHCYILLHNKKFMITGVVRAFKPGSRLLHRPHQKQRHLVLELFARRGVGVQVDS